MPTSFRPAGRGLCALLSLAFLVPPHLVLAQDPTDEALGGPLAVNEVDPVEDLSALDALDVDPTTGALLLKREDLRLGEGPDAFALTRTYKPWTGDALNMGHHWVTPFDVHLDLSADGSEAAFTGSDGVQVAFRRDEAGALQSLNGPAAWVRELSSGFAVGGLGDDVRYLFDAEGWLLARRTQGAEVRFVYDAERRLREVVGPWGKLAVERDDQGVLSALRGPGLTVRYVRDAAGCLTRVEREGAFEAYDYDPHGRLWKVAGGRAQVLWDLQGRVSAIHGSGVHPVRLAYVDTDEPEAALQVLLAREGRTERIHVSDDGRRIRRWAEGADSPSVSYLDARDRLVRHVAPDRGEVQFRYDDRGRLSERQDSRGATRFRYGSNATEQPTRIEQPDGQAIALSYDDDGRLIRVQAAGREVGFDYEQGRLVSMTDARGNVTRYAYDAHGYVKRVEDAAGAIEYQRDQAGRIQTLKAPDGRTVSVTWDALGRMTQLRDGRGVIRELEYDGRGRVVRRRDELGRRYHYTWNERGDLLQLRDSLGTLQGYEYDEQGEVVAFSDGAGSRTTLDRPDGQTLVVESASFGTRTLKHDAFGRLVAEQRGPHALSYAYDGRGRLVGRTTPSGQERFEYDDQGRVTRMQGPQGGFAMEYDGLGRLTALEDLNLERRVEYGYDELGDKTTLRLPWGEVHYEYDDQGRVEALVLPNDEGRLELSYDASGQRSQVRYPNGAVTDYRYAQGRLVGVETRRGEELLDQRAYGYDERGRVAWSEDAQGRTEYAHDARGRLTAEKGPDGSKSYYYDGAGNRIAETQDGAPSVALIRAGNRVAKVGERTLAYGPTGSVTEIAAGEATTRYVYDHDDKLVEVQRADGQVVRYGYAPNGQRLWREDGAGRTEYLNDLADVVGEFVDGELQTAYVHGPDVDDVLAATHGSGSFFYHRDLLGSVTAMTDAAGAVAARYRYDAFGNTLSAEGAATTWNPYRYTGRTWDAVAEVYDYRARSYDPTLGRFTSPDPAGLLGGVNLYAYVQNDPTQFTDPYGLKPWWKRLGDWTRDAAASVADGAAWLGDKALAVGAATVKGVVNVATNPVAFGKGFVKGVVGSVVGLYEMAKNPKAVWEGLKYAWNHPDEMKEMFGNKWKEFQDALENDPERFAEIMGQLTADVALAVVGTKGLDKVGKAAKALRVVSAAKMGGTATRVAGVATRGLAGRFPRTAAVVQRSASWSAARTRTLAQRATALNEMGWATRQVRRVGYVAGDVVRAGRMIRRSPLAYSAYTARRLGHVAGGLVTSSGSMAWKGVKYGGVPVLLTMQGPIHDSIMRTRNRADALGEVQRVSREFLEDVADLSPEDFERRLAELGRVHDDYRNQLFRPVHAEDGALQASVEELNGKVERGELADDAVDARLSAMFDDYTSRRLNLMATIYTGGAEAEHGPLNPSPNRLVAYMDHAELLRQSAAKLGDSPADAAKREALEREIADLEARAAYENELFRQGEHEALLAGINELPADWTAPEGEPGAALQGLIDPAAPPPEDR